MTHETDSITEIGEFGLIERIRAITGTSTAVIGVGDDTAVLEIPGAEYLLATIDMQIDGVHFRLTASNAESVGRRAMAVNLSDIAAMGGAPQYALVSLALMPDTNKETVLALYRGMTDQAAAFGATIVGGNLSRVDGPLAIDIAMLGRVPKGEVLLRSGALAGDALAVTGQLGIRAALLRAYEAGIDLSAHGLSAWAESMFVPAPRIDAGRALAASGLVHAMMDISDGLAGDIRQLCRASNVGANIHRMAVPIAPEMRALADLLGVQAETVAMSGGEEYELLLALPQSAIDASRTLLGELPLTVIGWATPADDGIVVEDHGERKTTLESIGWEHF